MSDQQSLGRLAGQSRLDGVVRDRIFVRGLVLPVAIGVYDEEQGVTQKVSFTIEASVAPGVSPQKDAIADVPSYDDLVGAVRGVVAAGHINLVETHGRAHRGAVPRRQAHRVHTGARREAGARTGFGRRGDRASANGGTCQ